MHNISQLALDAGATAIGVAEAGPIPADIDHAYEQWLNNGCHAQMLYLANHRALRADPRLLLDGAKSIIVLAFPYYHHDQFDPAAPAIAAFAHGSDYHDVLRARCATITQHLADNHNATSRICIDSAPIFERYWATQAGIGFIADNHLLIVPGQGSYFFLVEIITTATLPCGCVTHPCDNSASPLSCHTTTSKHAADTATSGISSLNSSTPNISSDAPSSPQSCTHCGRCFKACPTGALSPKGFDARRCLSYLTIEHRGELPPDTALHGRLFGCDNCQRVCPLNSAPTPTRIDEFQWRPSLRTLTTEQILTMTPDDFSTIMRGSPIKRAKLAGLQRNAHPLK